MLPLAAGLHIGWSVSLFDHFLPLLCCTSPVAITTGDTGSTSLSCCAGALLRCAISANSLYSCTISPGVWLIWSSSFHEAESESLGRALGGCLGLAAATGKGSVLIGDTAGESAASDAAAAG
jgi:hypothetical protein